MRHDPTLSRLRSSLYPCINLMSPFGGIKVKSCIAAQIRITDFLSSLFRNFSASLEYLITIERILPGLFYSLPIIILSNPSGTCNRLRNPHTMNIASPNEKKR